MENSKIKTMETYMSNDNSVKMDSINRMVDLFDEAAMKCYYSLIDEEKENTDVTNYNKERPSLNFYEALLKVIDYFLEEKPLHIDEDSQKEIDDILDAFRFDVEENGINTEEIRRALLLLDIKAFKNVNFPLDIITPDTIGMIFARLIQAYFSKEDKLTIVDPNFGIGNLMFTIRNHIKKELKMIGMDNHELLTRVAVAKANMMMEDLIMYYQDALEYQIHDIDVVVSDLATYNYENDQYHSELYDKGIRYFPYLVIENDVKSEEFHPSFYLIDNQFFTHQNSKEFNIYLTTHASIECLIVLPTTLFQKEEDAKSILVLTNKPKKHKDMHIFMLPSLSNTSLFISKLNEIEYFLKEIKEGEK